MRIDIWIILLGSIGLLISGYIAITHARNKKVICPINSTSCNAVLDSEWSNMLGIKNEIFGILYYLSIIVGVLLINQGYSYLLIVMKATATLSALYSVFLLLIQVRIIKEFCFYCLCTTIINIGIFVLLVK